ncbi:MAG: tat pathway signal sequence [Segniliparus sp.]|uniref:tat pathway signal sequence n=1 Tax=Segniliparus sp. TaxID=2804064 RepID=UPI003F30B642
MNARLRAALAGACVLAAVASTRQSASADTVPLPPDVDLAQLLPPQSSFPAGWTIGQAERNQKAASFSRDGILANFGKHATPKDCYPDALVFFSAFGAAKGGKPPEPASGSYVFVTIARPDQDPRVRGYTRILHYWVDNCAQYSVDTIPDWSSYPLAGSVVARTMPVVRADDSIAIRVKEKTSRGPDVEMTAIAARLRGVEVLVTGYPGADESLVDSLLRTTVERIDEWEP